MGEIVFWTIIRLIIIIPILWLSIDFFDENIRWLVISSALFLFIIYPAFIKHKKVQEQNKKIAEETLCSTCKHFNAESVLCLKYDKHPTEDFIPCEGIDWEPHGKI